MRPSPQRVGKICLADLDLNPGGLVLDVGCSIGANTRMLGTLGFRAIGVDKDRSLILRFQALARSDGLTHGQALGFVADGAHLPFDAACFDAVILIEVLEHTQEPERILHEVSRVLRSGGALCLSVPEERMERIFRTLHRRWIEFSTHFQIFSRERLLDMIKRAGFSCRRVTGENSEWTIFWLLFSILQVSFDHTGKPTAWSGLVWIFWKAWRAFDLIGIMKLIQLAGDRLFPKSIFVYAVKELDDNRIETEDSRDRSV